MYLDTHPLHAGWVLSFRAFTKQTWILCSRAHSQVLENIRNNSCEGLALPFLANWLMGASSSSFTVTGD